jgi:peptidoglycan/xylan/chitin deacetylase (PgdA/CDA1 family)
VLKRLAYDVAAGSRAPWLYHRFFRSRTASILVYHAVVDEPLAVDDWCFVDAAVFRRQMAYLKARCRVLPLHDVLDSSPAPVDRPVVALTFDDGFRNNLDVVLPVLQDFDLPATVFVVTGLVDTDDTLWFCRINAALARTSLSRFEWDGVVHDLRSARLRALAGARLQAALKRHPHRDLTRRTRALVEALGDDPERPVDRDSPYRMLDAGGMRRMLASGLVEFGAHTVSHAILSRLADDERDAEIEQSIRAVEALTGTACRSFAYPNGSPADYDRSDVERLARRGIAVAVTMRDGPNADGDSPFELRRYGIGSDTSIAQFQMLTHHLSWRLTH